MRDYSKITKPTPENYCAYCGKKMERKRINGRLEDLGAFKRRKYCNKTCMRMAFVKKDATEQSPGGAHQSARKLAYLVNNRDMVCEICGSTSNIDVHHKDENCHNNSRDNLMILCRSCHMKIHKTKGTCIICGKPMKGHGYCNAHYIRWKKYGDPLHYFNRKVEPVFFQTRTTQ